LRDRFALQIGCDPRAQRVGVGGLGESAQLH
jgi:hypothetical protein